MPLEEETDCLVMGLPDFVGSTILGPAAVLPVPVQVTFLLHQDQENSESMTLLTDGALFTISMLTTKI